MTGQSDLAQVDNDVNDDEEDDMICLLHLRVRARLQEESPKWRNDGDRWNCYQK